MVDAEVKKLHTFNGEDHEDFSVWLEQIQETLKCRKFLHCLEKNPAEGAYFTVPAGESDGDKKTREAKIQKREEEDFEVMEIIFKRLGNDQFRMLKDEPSVKCVVDKLIELHTKSRPSQRNYLHKKLQNLQGAAGIFEIWVLNIF